MTTFWVSLGLALGVLAVTVPLGGLLLFGDAVAALLLAHVFIGDLFHWSHFPRLGRSDRVLWLSLAALGLFVFLTIRQAGQYMFPLFYVYFFGHFWKDFDIGIGQIPPHLAEPGLRRSKRWCGLLLLLAYAVIASGLVLDAQVIGLAKKVAWVASGTLTALALVYGVKARTSRKALDILWSRYAGFSACFLVVCTWLDALHPSRSLLPHFMILWHFMLWYVFYWSTVSRANPVGVVGPRRGLSRVKHSLVGLTALILIVNGLAAVGAWMYGVSAQFHWLRYVYNFQYLVGCWTVMHVTWDWIPKEVKGVRLSLI